MLQEDVSINDMSYQVIIVMSFLYYYYCVYMTFIIFNGIVNGTVICIPFSILYFYIASFYQIVMHISFANFTYQDYCGQETFWDEISGNEQLIWSPNKVIFAVVDTVNIYYF